MLRFNIGVCLSAYSCLNDEPGAKSDQQSIPWLHPGIHPLLSGDRSLILPRPHHSQGNCFVQCRVQITMVAEAVTSF